MKTPIRLAHLTEILSISSAREIIACRTGGRDCLWIASFGRKNTDCSSIKIKGLEKSSNVLKV